MTHEEQRRFLIARLIEEMPRYEGIEIPQSDEGQQRLLRSLMNVRPPRPAGDSFLRVQDAFLQEETRRRGVVDCSALPGSVRDRRLVLWRGDITRLNADAIVNAANSALLGCFIPCHSCIDNIVHTCAGVQLRLKCHELMEAQGHEERTGTAKLTPAYNLPCKYILHTVGPVITGPLRSRDCDLLASCYRSCLELAAEHGLRSVAFCCISTGVFHFPQEKAAQIAVETVSEFLERETGTSLRQVIFDVFTDRDMKIYSDLLGAPMGEEQQLLPPGNLQKI